MEIEPGCITSSTTFAQHAVTSERCQHSKERVQQYIDRGLMRKDIVYQRYTEELSEKLTSARRYEQPAVIEAIKQSFQRLRDSESGYLSEVTFKRKIEERLSGVALNGLPNSSALLFEICSWHAFFPFPKPYNGSGQLQIDEDGFVRAVCLLTLCSARRYGLQSQASTHGYYSGILGPYRGWYIATRGRDGSDFRRRLFRSLAVPDTTDTERSTTKISVPRFMWYEANKEEPESEEEPGQQFIVAEDESETSIDVVDILSECPPEADRRVANPFRESYREVLPFLPQQTDELSMLYVPTTKVLALAKLTQEVQHKGRSDMIHTMGGLDSAGKVSWDQFDSAFAEHSELIAESLSAIFETFATT